MRTSRKLIRILVAASYFVAVSLLASCGFKDIDKRVFVTAIGIDPSETDDGPYKITLKLSLPVASIKSATGSNYEYLIHDGSTIAEAIRILETHTDKVLELGHTKLIVINESLFETDIKGFMDYFMRRGDIQLVAWVAAAKTSAESILKVEPKTESAVSTTLVNFFGSSGAESPFITSSYLFEFRRNTLSDGINAVVPLVEASKDKTELIVNKSLVVKEKTKPLELNYIETKYFNTLKNGMSGFSYEVERGDVKLIINMDRIRTNYKILMENGQPTSIKVNVKMKGEVGESNKSLLLENLDKYNKIASEEIEGNMTSFLENAQKHDLDPMGFGLEYRTMKLHDKKNVSEWLEAYPNLPIDVHVDVSLKGTGSIE
ncbi:Ger(x)C family spore germination protein [Bacillus sp. FJAT-22090]|uniref:Ger(x)C family spore germination protein n=1 Tax=Bacillus sp. FJAT-22090 TaxID=1581038 RepID=UPI0011A53BDE|nr:Ger(x)C family spore germination protein [Bacillus sp. FJAT-22090]